MQQFPDLNQSSQSIRIFLNFFVLLSFNKEFFFVFIFVTLSSYIFYTVHTQYIQDIIRQAFVCYVYVCIHCKYFLKDIHKYSFDIKLITQYVWQICYAMHIVQNKNSITDEKVFKSVYLHRIYQEWPKSKRTKELSSENSFNDRAFQPDL